jgi:hypothetical protein
MQQRLDFDEAIKNAAEVALSYNNFVVSSDLPMT